MAKKKKSVKPEKSKPKDDNDKRQLDEIMGALLKVPPKKNEKKR